MMLTRTAGCTGGRVAQFAAQRHARRLGRCYRLLSHAAAPEVASVEKKVPWLQGLNTSQEQAVLRTQGSYRVIAGPGSGKTKVLTSRVGQLLSQGVPPADIVAITFTRKARDEMKARLARLVGPISQQVLIGTFHSIGHSILRKHIQELPRTSRTRAFTLIDEDDMLGMLTDVASARYTNLPKRDAAPAASKDAKRVAKMITLLGQHVANTYPARGDMSKPRLREHYTKLIAAATKAAGGELFPYLEKDDVDLLSEFFTACEASNVVTLDELVGHPVTLLEKCDHVRDKLQARSHFVLVDEVQDCDVRQYRLVQLLAARHGNVFFVGDPNQSIYAFRGSQTELLHKADRDFKMETLALPENYRSTQAIVDASQAILSVHGWPKLRVQPQVQRSGGPAPLALHSASDEKQAVDMARMVRQLLRTGVPGHHIAILYPKHSVADRIEEALVGVPYLRYGRTKLMKSKVVKDLYSYLRIMANPNDEPALHRVRNCPARSLSDKGWIKIRDAVRGAGLRSVGDWIYGDLHDVVVAPDVVQQILDAAWTPPKPPAEGAPVRKATAKTKAKTALSSPALDAAEAGSSAVKATMASLSAEGLLAPPLPDSLGLSLAKPMRAGLQALRDIFVALATLQLLSGYRLSLVDSLEVQKADFMITAVSRPSTSFTNDWDPSSSDADAEIPLLPQEQLSFKDLLASAAGGSQGSLEMFEEAVANLKFLEEEDDDDANTEGKVTLMTVHKSKGLEWPVVMVVGLEEPKLSEPITMQQHMQNQAKEMHYVAVTRAQDALIVCSSEYRQSFGKSINLVPTPFLHALHSSFLDETPFRSSHQPSTDLTEIIHWLFSQGSCSAIKPTQRISLPVTKQSRKAPSRLPLSEGASAPLAKGTAGTKRSQSIRNRR